MKLSHFLTVSMATTILGGAAAMAAPVAALTPHKAVYDIDLVATHSGSQVLNISGQMEYEWKPTCGAWVTDHKFELLYEYADSPGMTIKSDFSTYETFDGKDFNFTSRRYRDGEIYQEIRGGADSAGRKATYTLPEGLKYELAKGTLFPMTHTIDLIKHAKAGEKIFSAQVFDGSDEEGPIEINTVITSPFKGAATAVEGKDKIDSTLLSGDAWNVRMAVFPTEQKEEESDYEMGMVFHENGIISDMLIDYDDFSVRQNLVALERLPDAVCADEIKTPKKP